MDAPRFKWRGTLLDVGRHFYSLDFVKRYLDVLAMHKINRFHWHLVEDQGWRIEIKALPALTDVGAWRSSNDERAYGGFYKQEEVCFSAKQCAAWMFCTQSHIKALASLSRKQNLDFMCSDLIRCETLFSTGAQTSLVQ